MTQLTRASAQLFTRPDDERFSTLDALEAHCRQVRESCEQRWQLPGSIRPEECHERLGLGISEAGHFRLNDWSFGQVCGLKEGGAVDSSSKCRTPAGHPPDSSRGFRLTRR